MPERWQDFVNALQPTILFMRGSAMARQLTMGNAVLTLSSW
jgi:hypothetical protein